MVAWHSDRASVYKALEAVEVVLRKVVFFRFICISGGLAQWQSICLQSCWSCRSSFEEGSLFLDLFVSVASQEKTKNNMWHSKLLKCS